MIVGSDDAEPVRNAGSPKEVDYFNSSFLINPGGEIVSRYCKRNLVIFGEYIPLVRWLPFIKWFTPITGGFASGDRVVKFDVERRKDSPGKPVHTATLICFEDIFPHLVREYVDDDTDFLINMTNNGWFGESAAQWQHAAAAVFRAVENGVPLLRCSNNGLTCWVDEHGRIRQLLRSNGGSVYGAGVMRAEIPVRIAGGKLPATFYRQRGDWFGWTCVAITAITALNRIRTNRARTDIPTSLPS
jgi:apolipoprotein N-acyltransferase